MLSVNPIIAATAANVILGIAIHYAFGSEIGKILEKKTTGFKDMPLRFALEILSSLMKASALYIAILIFQKSELSISETMLTKVYAWFITDIKMNTTMMASFKIAGFFWLGFMVPHILCHLAWDEQMNGRKSVLKAALSLVHLLVMAGVIAYFG
ncbi:hypothetical protein HYV10_01060 [Candidatus Dependentiae bacterium]|nr:hypothetical protein [Candidatus Dependentiae bacterium]